MPPLYLGVCILRLTESIQADAEDSDISGTPKHLFSNHILMHFGALCCFKAVRCAAFSEVLYGRFQIGFQNIFRIKAFEFTVCSVDGSFYIYFGIEALRQFLYV